MRKQMSERLDQLRRRGQELATVLESMVEGVIAVDQNRRILFANRAACEMLEVGSANITGRPLWETVQYPEVELAVDAALRNETPQRREFGLLRFFGGVRFTVSGPSPNACSARPKATRRRPSRSSFCKAAARADSRAELTAGIRIAASRLIMTITTSNSMSVTALSRAHIRARFRIRQALGDTTHSHPEENRNQRPQFERCGRSPQVCDPQSINVAGYYLDERQD